MLEAKVERRHAALSLVLEAPVRRQTVRDEDVRVEVEVQHDEAALNGSVVLVVVRTSICFDSDDVRRIVITHVVVTRTSAGTA